MGCQASPAVEYIYDDTGAAPNVTASNLAFDDVDRSFGSINGKVSGNVAVRMNTCQHLNDVLRSVSRCRRRCNQLLSWASCKGCPNPIIVHCSEWHR
eukprot:3441104-Amphidinium_carterae.1